MRAIRGLTAITSAALVVVTMTTGAEATDRDDLLEQAAEQAPTAAVVPGSSAAYVSWPPDYQEYFGSWTGANAIELSRNATTVDLTLPHEILVLPFLDAGVWIDAGGSSSSARVAGWTDDFASGNVTFDLQALLAQAVAGGVPDASRLEINVDRMEDDVVLDLLIAVTLVDGAAGPAQVALDVPLAKTHTQELSATAVRVGPGGRVTVQGWPGVFDPHFWTARFATADWSGSVTTGTGWGMPDGSVVSFEVPADVGSYAWLQVQSGTAYDRRTVTLALVPPVTGAVEAYVTAVYNDLFGRDPDPTGLAGWTGALMRGVPYSAVSDAITASDEFRMGLITDAYERYLGRSPDPAGLAGWLRAMNRGLHIQQMEAGFLASDEYFQIWGQGTNAGWIRSLYVDVLGRPASAAEVQAWLPGIARDGREQVSRGFLYSTEKLRTDVDGYYLWLVRRGSDTLGRDSWVRAIQNGVRVEVIIAGIIASQEYRNNVPVG